MKYAHIIAAFYAQVWALRPETLFAMQRLLHLQAGGQKWTEEEIAARIADANAESGYKPVDRLGYCYYAIGTGEPLTPEARRGSSLAKASGTVAVIPIVGIISHRLSMMSSISGPGGTSTTRVAMQLREALDDGNCKAIVFDVDSPGGSVEGVQELASEIYQARKKKPITAVCNAMSASAAYWIASAAKDLVITPSGQAGSIGVYVAHQDESKAMEMDGIKVTLISAGKFKVEGNPTEPLSDAARASLQKKVDDYYTMFVKGVAQNRGASQADVRNGYGEGRMLLAADAVKENLADRVSTFDAVLEEYGVKRGNLSTEASSSLPAPKAVTDVTNVTASTEPDDDPEDGIDRCPCSCEPCKGCTGRSDGKVCDACKSCTTGACACNKGAKGFCQTPHFLGEPTADQKALKQNPHAREEGCRDWKLDPAVSVDPVDYRIQLARRRLEMQRL